MKPYKEIIENISLLGADIEFKILANEIVSNMELGKRIMNSNLSDDDKRRLHSFVMRDQIRTTYRLNTLMKKCEEKGYKDIKEAIGKIIY